MLSSEDNELLCRVGRGTPMGVLLRHYWMPCLPSTELPAPDGPPKTVRLLGENLVAFRDTRGEVGLLSANCPHRGAPIPVPRPPLLDPRPSRSDQSPQLLLGRATFLSEG
jgi:hypothetical protein